MSKKQTKKQNLDFEFWNNIAIAVQNATIKIDEFEDKLVKLDTKLEQVQQTVDNISTIQTDIQYLKKVAKQVTNNLQSENTKEKTTETQKEVKNIATVQADIQYLKTVHKQVTKNTQEENTRKSTSDNTQKSIKKRKKKA